ncbi:MAG: sigma-54-dependent Fis family transcriptional regulator [Planctomycetes bacterium]|nr:sigma-54-dependent Fis family transcriptional regulator [Planctomycetota bacterium]
MPREDALFAAWALSIAGEPGEALEALGPPKAFFAGAGLRPALSLARWVGAEAAWLAGREEALGDALAALAGPPASALAAFLWPLLAARLLLERAAGAAERARCADLLAGAGAAMAAQALPEWSARLEALRGALGEDPAAGAGAAAARRAELTRGLDTKAQKAHLESPHWAAWTRLPASGARRAASRRSQGSRSGAAEETRTVDLPRRVLSPARARLVARSRPMRALLASVERLRSSELVVLIRGETGTGKELVARVLHEESRRARGPFCAIDCRALPPELFEAELFGAELFGARAGSFTGIDRDRPGLLAMAAGGTVLLDEVGETPLAAQAKLLRVLAEGAARPVGGEAETPLDVRFLCTSSVDLDAAARAGRLRRDLLHRMRVVTVDVPPLRDRPEDLPGLVEAILAEGGGQPPALGPGVLDRLRELPWPGNVRELRGLLARLRVESPHRIAAEDIERAIAGARASTVFPPNLLAAEDLGALKDKLERDYVAYHHRRLGGDTGALCAFLGLGRRQLYRRCARLGIAIRELRGR